MKVSRRGIRRLPWKRGPLAWGIRQRTPEILANVSAHRRQFLSLREAAKLLGVSTQPVRDWILIGYLKRDGPRKKISKVELRSFVEMLVKRAEPYDWRKHGRRFQLRNGRQICSFSKLANARFTWPETQEVLTPKAIARLAGCHPSFVRKALISGKIFGQHPTPYRWEIERGDWRHCFPGTIS